MAEAPVLGAGRSVELDGDAFGARFNGPLVHESVRAEFAARRRGSASTKTRGLVSGGGAKPWRQKGTGRARAGSSRSPVWTGGGTVFGPHPRSYTFKVNRKERRAALRSALSLHAERGSLAILDTSAFTTPSTRTAATLLNDWGAPRSTLVVVTPQESAAALSFRNIYRVAVLEPPSVGIADIIGAASLLCSAPALAELTERAKASSRGEDATEAAGAPKAPAKAPTAMTPAIEKAAAPVPAPAKASRPSGRTSASASATDAKSAAESAPKPKAAAKPKLAAKPKPVTATASKPVTPKPKAAAPKRASAKAPKDAATDGEAVTSED